MECAALHHLYFSRVRVLAAMALDLRHFRLECANLDLYQCSKNCLSLSWALSEACWGSATSQHSPDPTAGFIGTSLRGVGREEVKGWGGEKREGQRGKRRGYAREYLGQKRVSSATS